jgi:branched-chain amino acid transport system ATP-binding protein
MLEAKGLSRSFGKLVAVDRLDLSVGRGTIHGLIGPNGSGKSTTMNLISGSLKPSAGQVSLNDCRIDGKSQDALARDGLIRTFQLTRVFAELTVFEAVRLGALDGDRGRLNWRAVLPFPKRGPSADRAMQAIEKMGLGDVVNQVAGSLPGGRQRVLSIATALAASPQCLLLDEPLAGLTATEKADVATRIELLRDEGITILLVEHDMKSVMRLCDRVTVINFGQRVADGSPAEIGRNEAVIKAYLGEKGARHAAG